jgi:fatty acid desaturase
MTDLAMLHFIREANAAVRDLTRPRPAIYWTDFLLTLLVTYAAFAVFIAGRFPAIVQIAAFVVSGLAMFRAVVFTHELVHQRAGSLAGFGLAWNLLCGVPLLMPSFLYSNHSGHHRHDAYGTWADPEYLLRTSRWRFRVVVFMLLPVIYPLLPFLRFLVLTPLAAVSARMNLFVWRFASSLYVMNEVYRREPDATSRSAMRWAMEVLCCLWAWTILVLTVSGTIPLSVIGRTYLLLVFWMAVNQVRTLVSHRYVWGGESPVSYLDQVLDTNTFIRGKVWPHLWAPLGLRYHALHHLLPALPYHAMGAAHRRLVSALPAGSPYHRTFVPGLLPVLATSFRASAAPPAMHR